MSFIIKEPEFINLKNSVRFKLVESDGLEKIAEFKVPESRERGVNKYWDYILDNFDIDKMRDDFNKKVDIHRREEQHRAQKIRADAERRRLQHLFDQKATVFRLPFVKSASNDVKAAIRRAPTHEILIFLTNELTRAFIKENNMTFNDYMDYIDDLEYEQQQNPSA